MRYSGSGREVQSGQKKSIEQAIETKSRYKRIAPVCPDCRTVLDGNLRQHQAEKKIQTDLLPLLQRGIVTEQVKYEQQPKEEDLREKAYRGKD